MFVMGGSYKGFYINELSKVGKIDLAVFHQDIFYEFDISKENGGRGIVSKELIYLNKKLKCPILVYGILKNKNIRNKCYILCSNGKINLIRDYNDIYLYIKGGVILISNRICTFSKALATISLIKERYQCEDFGENYPKNYFLCDKKGVSYIKGGKIYRKFRKCCYFTLNFKKKML